MAFFTVKLKIALVLTFVLIIPACIPQSSVMNIQITQVQKQSSRIPQTPISSPTPSLLKEYYLPPYYSNSYSDLVEASKNENGLIIYSILGKESWQPVIDAFNAHFPWIRVTTVDLGANEVFERYAADSITGERTADLIVSSAPDGWLNFANTGQIAPYISEEDIFVPPWARLAPGVYTIASDPMVILYNKESIPNPPQSMADLATLIEEDPEEYNAKITSYDAAQNSTGMAINWFWTNIMGDSGWDILDRIGRTKPSLKTSASSMVSSVLSGDTSIGYFVSPVAFLPLLDQQSNLGWAYITDGQPILMRSIAVTNQAASPNSAKLMTDFLLSQEGQLSLALGGMTPYRSDIANVEIFKPVDGSQKHIHFNQVIEAVGLNNLIFINLDPEIIKPEKRDIFIKKWNGTMGR
jgi:iron(III) transport system substrate-binding protein